MPALPVDVCIRVVVIDDHPAVCQALQVALTHQPDMCFCGYSVTAAEAHQLIESSRPDVAVVDLSLSDAYGLSLIPAIRQSSPGTQVVVFSMGKESAFAERAIRVGALGYVSKTESSAVVIDAIRAAYNGRTHLSPSLALKFISRAIKGSLDERAGLDALTDQELAIVHLLGVGRAVHHVAQLMGINRKTVVSYQRRAMEKLGCTTTGDLLLSIREIACD
ncbi:MAG TPA: response regulator transcription factor [Rhodothermales bacterium]|nr:response regulator transcription factor [Rhodothermales bacterium]